jgi:alkylation response protein AidB-like acyl-CoA dehydrogenase
MQLAWSAQDEAFRAELATFLDTEAPPEAHGYDFGESRPDEASIIPDWLRAWQAKLFDNGWMIPAYPPELGGRNSTPIQTLIYLEELSKRRIPRATHFPGYAIVAPSLLEFGNDEQKKLVPAAIRGDTIWCIGMSEPNAGSDLAGLQTRAQLFDDHFVVNGQKVWTSYAMIASKCFCYVRTDPSAPKHRGISLLIIDMDTPGIDVRPLRHINGKADFAEVFFTDVEVPRENLVGELNGGWMITQGSLAHERAGLWVDSVSRLEQTVLALVDLAKRTGHDLDPVARRRIAEKYELAASLRALGYKGFASFAQGSSAPEHSYMKMATSEAGKAVFELGMELCGPFGAVTDPELGDENGRWVNMFFMSFANTIAGGSSEIQRNIIAQRILGLPRK